jgi:hypothetical protein
MTHRLAGDSAPLEDHLREFSREVLAMNDAAIDWQFYRTWQCVSSRAIDVWDIYTRLAARPMSFARRHELVRQLVDSGLDCGSLVGPMLHQLPPSEFKALIKELERAGPTASSALPYVFAHLGGPNERFVIRTLKAIDPDGRACWNLFRDKELQASDPPQRILALEKVLRRQFGAPRR